MAETILVCDSDSDSDTEVTTQSRPNPPPKRRRILDSSAITAVPIYSGKVTRSLQLKPAVFKQAECTDVSEKEVGLWPLSTTRMKTRPISASLSDSEEQETEPEIRLEYKPPSSPSPPCTPPVFKTNRANKQIREINKKLDVLHSLMSLTPERSEDITDSCDSPSEIHDRTDDDDDDDDIIIISSKNKQKRPKPKEHGREISLKFRWRMDVHRIPVLSTDPLSKAIAQLSVKLNVPPSKILVTRNDDELPVHSTIKQLDLGIADIIDCLVITDDKEDERVCDVITLRLQGKEKESTQEYSLHKDAPLGSILSQYTSGLSATAKRKVKFLFDGVKVTKDQTPSQLDMEDGDVIEVWT